MAVARGGGLSHALDGGTGAFGAVLSRGHPSADESDTAVLVQVEKRLARGHPIALHYMYYLVRRHETMTKGQGGIHTTPAMAAGVADHLRKVSDTVVLLVAREQKA